MTPEKIERINVLARKAKTIGLNDQEKEEQAALRQEYIQAMRNSLRANLNSLKIVDEEGNVLKDYGDDKLKDKPH
ncbi:hypothetical protein BEP19_04720 [Ammoniphilus oxalaticus]|uniref:UPF0291 protein BEP19_04720 n=1 Tax=Ammoniphilus oxalaticus TaxID=66863 RepID=A0A419SM53_9BACL|nr:hypothetical protein BEP19_04720 [Ammoniphilus oxalaticus]